MAKFKQGDLLEVKSDQVEFLCSVSELLGKDVVSKFEDCVAAYLVRWEGAINPDVEPKITLWEYSKGDVYASDESEGGFEYQEVEVTIKKGRNEMKNYISYVEGNKETRIVEVLTHEFSDSRANSLAGIAQEICCKAAVMQMSKIFKDVVFLWGHEENDGRTWMHGVVVGGKYRATEIGKETKVKTHRKVTVVDASGEEKSFESDDDPFELDMSKFGKWRSVHFQADGRDVGTIFRNLGEGEEMEEEAKEERYYPERFYTDNGNKKGDVVSVFGWYGAQEWVEVELMRLTHSGWAVKRVEESKENEQ